MDIAEFQRRVDENRKTFIFQQENKFFDASKYYGFDSMPGELIPVVLMKKDHDIYAAAFFGFLAYLRDNHGADAVKLDGNLFVDVELKTCYSFISDKLAFKTKDNTIYFTQDTNLWKEWVPEPVTTSASSHFAAKFKFATKATHDSKRRDTYFMAIDAKNGEIICAYSLTGDQVIEYLKSSKDIKLGSFKKSGVEIINGAIKTTGWGVWHSRQLPLLQVKRRSTDAKEVSRAERVAKSETRRLLKLQQKQLKASLPTKRSRSSTKNHPSLQIPILCTEALDQL